MAESDHASDRAAFMAIVSKTLPKDLRIEVDVNLVQVRTFVRDTGVQVIEVSASQPPQVGVCTPAIEAEQCVIEAPGILNESSHVTE